MKLASSIFIILFIGLLSRSLLPSNSTSDSDFEFDMSDLEIKPQDSIRDENNFNEDPSSETYTPVMTLDYRGEWSSYHIPNQLSEFIQTAGFATFTARKKNSKVIDDYIEFWFYDGKYIDNKALKIAFAYNNNTDFNPQNATFKNSYIEFYAALYENFNQIKESICAGKYQLSFIDKTTQKPYQKASESYENTEAQIWLQSFNCDISIFSRVFSTDSVYESDVMDYSILMTLICISHLYACVHMIRSINRSETLGHGYSLLTLAIITSWDIYLCLFHLYEAINLDMGLFHYFITPAFWYFILASIFQTRLLTMVWKTRYYRLFETITDIRRGFASFYVRLYGFMSIFIVMSYFYATEIWFMYLTSLFFVPQIVHNAIRGQKVKFDALYVFFFGFLRLILPLYARGYSYSIFKLTPDSSFIVYYPSILLFQVTALYLQSKLGSRFFIPAHFLPPKHNYFQKIFLHSLQKEDACSICMDNLGHDSSCLKTPMLKIDENSMIQVMKTPCKHIFHEKCLKDWMDIKLECPYCRTMLPSLES